MRKSKKYRNVKFSARLIHNVIDYIKKSFDIEDIKIDYCLVRYDDESLRLDSAEEFFDFYRKKEIYDCSLRIFVEKKIEYFEVELSPQFTNITVSGTSKIDIEKVFSFFSDAAEDDIYRSPEPPRQPISVFIGHGRDPEWLKLSAHLRDKHGIEIVAYETGARAGHAIRDILESMAERSSFALLVLTGEDQTESGNRARQNVIHECGLFQGRLGFDRAVLLVEQDIEMASNFDGIQQLRFEKGRIGEVFGDVLATLRREFGPL